MGGFSWFLLMYQSFFESKLLKTEVLNSVSVNAVGGLMTESTYHNNELINLNPEFYQKVTKTG